MNTPPRLGLATGMGLVAANMIGTGVLLSAGFMAQELDAGEILLSWIAGLGIAALGAVAYSEHAVLSGRSGGEYRFLTDRVHPFAGQLAGWASLLVGFSAPIALDALALEAFLGKVAPVGPRGLAAALAVLLLAALHGGSFMLGKTAQNVMVALKAALLVGFTAAGLIAGSRAWPAWTPPHDPQGMPVGPFLANQYWVAFAFSGWNAAVYAVAEFRSPKRDVPRAMLLGTALVGGLYLAVNWVFVANLAPERAIAVATYDESRLTLAHLVSEDLFGPTAAGFVSLAVALALVSAMSAMTFLGPRVVAEMAGDGALPAPLAAMPGGVPARALGVQTAIALALVLGSSAGSILQAASAVLMLSSAATALSLWSRSARSRAIPRVAALLYAIAVAAILAGGFHAGPSSLIGIGVVLAAGTAAWLVGGRRAAPRERGG